ncbi:MAG: hypothetical protein VX185_03535 [Pseudomonadota bacterium]|nr:hypothetical protein [Pseudomonadota bacterium]
MKEFLFIFLLVFGQNSLADTCAVNKNVKDYFLSIPSQMLVIFDDEKGPLVSKQAREAAIDTLDVKNDFMVLQGDTLISKYEIALFRSTEKKPVVLVTADGVSVQNVYAFSCFGDKWHDVSGSIFPKETLEVIADLYLSAGIMINGKYLNEKDLAMVSHTLVRYKLPRMGESIQAYASHPDILNWKEHVLYDFKPKIR